MRAQKYRPAVGSGAATMRQLYRVDVRGNVDLPLSVPQGGATRHHHLRATLAAVPSIRHIDIAEMESEARAA